MKLSLSKAKLTLWVSKEARDMGKRWSRRHHESISQLFSTYLKRLVQVEEGDFSPSPLVSRLTGVIRGKGIDLKSYRRHLEDKYSDG